MASPPLLPKDDLRRRLWKAGALLEVLRERALTRLHPARLRFVPYSWPLSLGVCPCDQHFCSYLKQRGIRGKAVFHFGTGGHHLVGITNHQEALGNDILGLTLSPKEHEAYERLVIRDPALGHHYKVLFADIHSLSPTLLPVFDVITLFHLCEADPPDLPPALLDDGGVLALAIDRLAPGGRVLLYSGSSGAERTRQLVQKAVEAGPITFEERYESLEVYRRAP